MPEQSHPPYVPGARTIPRQLNRWLDVNAQNGPLERTKKFVTLPAFNIPYAWQGYSDIVGTFNFEASHNFSFKVSSIAPVSPNYFLCISYRIGGVVTRYALWENVGEILFFQRPTLYSGQPILKNFRLEIWSAGGLAFATNNSALTFYTTVLGDLDYRYGLDSELIQNDGLVTNFGYSSTDIPANQNLVGVGATYTIFTAPPNKIYTVAGFLVGQSYTLSGTGNAVKIFNGAEEHFPGDTFIASNDQYALVGPADQLVTSTVIGPVIVFPQPETAFFLPITFPPNTVSQTN